VLPATVLPRDFDTIEIPFAERGEPSLVHWDAEMATTAAATTAAATAAAATTAATEASTG
jgi:hypothetical protein